MKIEKAKNRAGNIAPVIRQIMAKGGEDMAARRGDGSRSARDQDAARRIVMAGGASAKGAAAA